MNLAAQSPRVTKAKDARAAVREAKTCYAMVELAYQTYWRVSVSKREALQMISEAERAQGWVPATLIDGVFYIGAVRM